MKEQANPIVVPCRGVSATGKLTVDVAGELERLGADVSDADKVPTGAGEVVALDGCASGCSARALEAHGVEPALALDLSKRRTGRPGDTHRIAGGVLNSLRERRKRQAVRRARSGFPSATGAMSRRHHTADDYLLAIDRLSSATVECGAVPVELPTIAAHVSLLLDVTQVSVAQMIGHLEAEGLVHRSPSKSLMLTPAGRARADIATRRQRILECFVTQFLGYDVNESFERAFAIGPSFDDDAIDHAVARAESAGLMSLPAVASGDAARIERIAEDHSEAVEQFQEAGLSVGDTVTVVESGNEGDVTVKLGAKGATVHFGPGVARAISVVTP
ncbi:MAG: FeoA domain-containing protein [Actinobacteria bacterium]|nr:FeoA domain-containing protein [Actinomycetota bacterium]